MSSLSAKYQAFLARPTAAALADDADLHYITTLTSIKTAPSIIKHFTVQEKILKRKGDKVLGAIESGNALSIELETTLEFLLGGGAYLPGLDDNFVADRTVSFPMVHIVQFDGNQKIQQIRMYWEQASLLKHVDVIGARARNWPIRDAADQARLIASSVGSSGQDGPSTASSRRSTASRGPNDVTITSRPGSSRSNTSHTSPTKDPHASLNLFQPRDIEQEVQTSNYKQPARGQSAKPPPREYSELFAGADQSSPSKERIPSKAGSGKVHNNRLFDQNEEPVATPLSVKTNNKKYNHFDFGDGEDADADATPKQRDAGRSKNPKHQSQWDFEDFVTPQKTKTKVLAQAVRNFGWSDDEEETSPVSRPIVHKARPDAVDAHFQLTDEATPAGDRKIHNTSKGRLHNKGLGLYQDHVTHTTSDDEEQDNGRQGDNKRALNDVTTAVSNEHRKKDFGSQFQMQDDSPLHKASHNSGVGADRQKVVKSLDAHWGLYEESPETVKREQAQQERGYKTAGNGMGGRKGAENNWILGDESAEFNEGTTNMKPSMETGRIGSKNNTQPQFGDERPIKPAGVGNGHENENGTERGYRTAGNGMGGKKGAEAHWMMGDENAEFNAEFKTPAKNRSAVGDKSFWDF